ncbi:MAG: ABC transporter ATP-binding protein [Candidatus Heimdallarchaeota archaeon]|nr:MAG: ABC transporter ATP-binding protein [Candidatus Heimdallarchaeota archaeon]
MTTAIETYELTKVFLPNIIAVNQLTLSINEGEIFAFLGPNGAGKTTTVRLLTTLITPTSGNASVAGSCILENKLELRRKIGFLSDRPNLYLRLSARKNLLFFAKMYGLTHQEASRRIDEMATQFELKERLDSPVGSYSKGMKQKLGILKAMIHSPPLMFLDEPTAGLDPLAQASVRETIERAADELDTTIFMTTHNLPEAERLADKIGVINKGKLLIIGSASELRSKISKSNKLVVTCLDKVSGYERLLSDLEGILSIHFLENGHSLEVEVTSFNEITPIIVRSLVEKGVSILEVRPTQKSLEEIYKQIMNNSNGGTENAA